MSVEHQGKVAISKKLVMINSSSSLVALALNITVLVWMQQYLLSRISTDEYSLLPVLYSIMMFTPLITVTLTSGLGRYTTAAFASGDESKVTQIASTMTPILAFGAVVIGVGGTLLSLNIEQFLTIKDEYVAEARVMFLLLMLFLSFKLLISPYVIGMEMTQRYTLLNLVMTGGQFFRIALIYLFLTLVSVKVLWVIVATVVADTAVQLTLYLLSRRAVPSLRFKPAAIDFTIARQLLSFGGWSTLTAIALSIRSSADAIVLNKLGTPTGVTCYYLGALPIQYINRASSVALNPLNPALIAMHTSGQQERLARVFLKGGRWALWFTLAVSVPLMVYGEQIITLYVGEDYKLAGTVMLLMLLTYPLEQGIRMLFPLAEASANIRKLSLAMFAMSITNLLLTLALVGKWELDAMGSVWGTVLSMLIFYPLVLWPLALKIAGVSWKVWFQRTVFPGVLPAIVSAVYLYLVGEIFNLNNWLALAVAVLTSGVVYLIILLVWALQEDEKRDLHTLISRYLPKFTKVQESK